LEKEGEAGKEDSKEGGKGRKRLLLWFRSEGQREESEKEREPETGAESSEFFF
jgi:hypothetical protein